MQLKVEHIKQETPDTRTFYLSDVSGNKVIYKAGQFITLVINHHGEEIRRSYSLSSSPDEDLLSVTIKRIPNGEVTRYLHTYSKPGDAWNAVEPAGRFVLPENLQGKTLFYFAAGSGISPVYAHIKHVLKHQPLTRIILVYSNLTQQSIIFKNELNKLSERYPSQLTIINLVSDEGKRLNNLVVEKLVKQYLAQNFTEADYYLCGPFAYMRMVRLTLLYMGIDSGKIHKENYVLETVPVITSGVAFAPQKLLINFQNKLHDLQQGENQTILQAALQNNLHLPYSCGAGVCAACAVKCTRGKVTVVKNEVLTDAELSQGWVLTCTGYAVTDDVELDFGS
ncbi:ferredoxin--NADP reductase [uncultured Mucilaginibacter sp.]|uniref:ferredoxin--NADP reductase n=1 Tax=uncultured Mucilaginibacter sp. TaxID=797541 RepID=UPI0025D37829|nr:ferredoxin--NADP reductase [uncultured Mucilaginibacter sp.]